MTYEEALKHKQENTTNGEFVFPKGLKSRVMVTPYSASDLHAYIMEYDQETTKDEDAKKYSMDNEFYVWAICIENPIGPGIYPW